MTVSSGPFGFWTRRPLSHCTTKLHNASRAQAEYDDADDHGRCVERQDLELEQDESYPAKTDEYGDTQKRHADHQSQNLDEES